MALWMCFTIFQMTCSSMNVEKLDTFPHFSQHKHFSVTYFFYRHSDTTLKGAFLWQIIRTRVFSGWNPTMNSHNIIKNAHLICSPRDFKFKQNEKATTLLWFSTRGPWKRFGSSSFTHSFPHPFMPFAALFLAEKKNNNNNNNILAR